MKPYIYKVTDKVTGEFYIGSQCRGLSIGKNYFTSSTNKTFRNKFKSNPCQFEIKIIGTFTNPQTCVLQENIFIKDNLKNPLCLNRCYTIGKNRQFNSNGNAFNKGRHHSEETRKKMSVAHKGRVSPNKGIHLSEETKRKLSEINKKRHISEETRKRISEAKRGKPRSEETKKKLSEILKGKPSPNKGKTLSCFYKKVICVETQIIYDSIKDASIAVNIPSSNISECAKHKRETAKGFHWEYVDKNNRKPLVRNKKVSEETRKKISMAIKGKQRPDCHKKIICVETQVIFNSLKEASSFYNTTSTNIGACANHRQKTACGFHWEYVDL